jgi:hypothetical protein
MLQGEFNRFVASSFLTDWLTHPDGDPVFALTTLYDTQLYDAVFALPNNRPVEGEKGDTTRLLPMAHHLTW